MTAGLYLPPEESFPYLYQKISKNPTVNAAHSGACLDTEDCYYPKPELRTLKNEVFKHRPDYLINLIGINDLWYGKSKTDLVKSYRILIRRSVHNNVQLILPTLLPVGESLYDRLNPRRLRVNDWLLSHERLGYKVVDLSKALSDKKGLLSKKYDIGDHLHLNPEANLKIAKILSNLNLKKPPKHSD